MSRCQKSEFSRDRVRVSIMEEIGYEDCDYISHELDWHFRIQFWKWKVSWYSNVHPRNCTFGFSSHSAGFYGMKLNCHELEDNNFIMKSIGKCFVFLHAKFYHGIKGFTSLYY